MTIQIIVDWLFVVAGAYFIFVPFERKRVRAGWAKVVFMSLGLLGVVKGIACLFLDAHWHDFSDFNRHLIDDIIRFIYDGFFLGAALSLKLSGQLKGIKRLDAAELK